MKLGIAILAAGSSSRLGQPKQLVEFRGQPLLQHALDAALAQTVATVAVVLGANAATIRERIALPKLVIENPDWAQGMGTSVRAGVSALLAAEPSLDAVILMLCDQPFVTAATLRSLVTIHESSAAPVVAAAYSDRLAVPALFVRALFPELLALHGARGAQSVIEAHAGEAAAIPFPRGAIDIDTAEDLQRLHQLPSETPTCA